MNVMAWVVMMPILLGAGVNFEFGDASGSDRDPGPGTPSPY